MNIYLETAKKLQRLGLNETKMSQEQFVRYASVLKKYRTDIIAGANEILRHFWFGGFYVKKDGQAVDALCREVWKIIDDESAKREMKRLKDILFQTYSLEKFLDAACRVHCRIQYEAYAPYWISTCEKKPLPDGIPWAGIPSSGAVWYNQMIDMYWQSEYEVWVSESEMSWRTSLPPTKELCEAEYAKERKVMGSA